MTDSVVIIGGGQAAGQMVASLRQEGFAGGIILVGDEPYPPYQRPPLSKKFLSGELERERLYIKPEAFFADNNAELRLGRRADAVDRDAKLVTLDDGTLLPYGTLVLATGSRVRRIPVPGEGLPGVHYLRGIDDVAAIHAHFQPGKKLVIIGAGYIGLEVAAVCAKAGLSVTVLEMEDRVMARVTAPEMSAFFQDVHSQAGVDIRLQTQVSGFEDDRTGSLKAVLCKDGSRIEADFAIVGIGILPNIELADAAGLACENGIVVDDHGRTADPAIFAVGDCANHPNDLVGRRIRLESVQNAIDQAKSAAAAIAGKEKPYREVPWFWSDQYDLKLQIAGLSEGYDQLVLRGDPASRKFAAFYLKGGTVIAVDAVNAVPEFMIGRKLIAAKAQIPVEKLADTAISMKELGAGVS